MKQRNRLRDLKKRLEKSTNARVAYAMLIKELIKEIDNPEEIFRKFTINKPLGSWGQEIANLAETLDLKL